MALAIEQIHHVQITVPRAAEEAAKHFYGTVLGLTEIPKPDNLKQNGGAWFRLGDVELHVAIEDVPGNEASRRHICFMVADIAQAEQALRHSGIDILPDRQPIDEWLRFYVRDPGGNRVEVAQRYRR